MSRKNHQWESTGVVSTKYPLKVKLELFTILEYQSWDELCVPIFWGYLGFYSARVGMNYVYLFSEGIWAFIVV